MTSPLTFLPKIRGFQDLWWYISVSFFRYHAEKTKQMPVKALPLRLTRYSYFMDVKYLGN